MYTLCGVFFNNNNNNNNNRGRWVVGWVVGRAGGQEVAFFGALAKGNVSSSIALAGRGFLPKSCLLIKYSPLCNLQTETFLQNPKRIFLNRPLAVGVVQCYVIRQPPCWCTRT